MTTSPALQARRTLVQLLLKLGVVYGVVLNLHRDSVDLDVSKAFKKVLLKAHPDKGGSEQHTKDLTTAKDRWEKAKKPVGRPKDGGSATDPEEAVPTPGFLDIVDREEAKVVYRIQAVGALLTYFRVQGLAQWYRFVDFVAAQKQKWNIRHWGATLETTKRDRLHIHLFGDTRAT